MEKKLTEQDVVNDFLNNDYTPAELARYYDKVFFPGRLSAKTISSILKTSLYAKEHKDEIAAKMASLSKRVNSGNMVTVEEVYRRIDQELSKIVHDESLINKHNIMMLRCTYLYISGYNYAEISKILYLSKSTVSKYIGEVLSAGLLNEITKSLLQDRRQDKGKYNPNHLNEAILKVVKTFIETGGDYKKTIQISGISDRTLTRYLAHPELKSIIGDETFEQVKRLVRQKNVEQAHRATEVSMRNQNIRTALAKVKTRSKNRQVLELMLLDGLTDLKKIAALVDVPESYILRLLDKTEEIEYTYGEYVYQELLIYKKSLPKKDINPYDDTKLDLIKAYLGSRYRLDDFMYEYHLGTENLRQYFFGSGNPTSASPEEWETLKGLVDNHISEVTTIYKRCPRDKRVIDRFDLVAIADEKTFYVTDTEYKLLNNVAMYFACDGNLGLCAEKYHVNYAFAYNSLSSPILQVLLSDEAYHRLQTYLKYEDIITSAEHLANKRDLLRLVVTSLNNNKDDVAKTLDTFDMPVEVLKRLLKDDVATQLYASEAVAQLLERVDAYEASLKAKANSKEKQR